MTLRGSSVERVFEGLEQWFGVLDVIQSYFSRSVEEIGTVVVEVYKKKYY